MSHNDDDDQKRCLINNTIIEYSMEQKNERRNMEKREFARL
jgi:hypothetical protein